jgi:hypothetical protein
LRLIGNVPTNFVVNGDVPLLGDAERLTPSVDGASETVEVFEVEPPAVDVFVVAPVADVDVAAVDVAVVEVVPPLIG